MCITFIITGVLSFLLIFFCVRSKNFDFLGMLEILAFFNRVMRMAKIEEAFNKSAESKSRSSSQSRETVIKILTSLQGPVAHFCAN